jgi:GrpB-like predicted nucleotidyltransferase (UPF0157 family)
MTTSRPPTTKEQIEAATVGKIEPLTGPIVLAEYDPTWPQLYAREEARIRAAVDGRVLRIEHTGSTSVPGLAAKPIIDITMFVADVSDEPAYLPDLEAAGYVLRIRENEPEWYDHRVFKGPDTNVNLHVFSDGCVELERMLGFRDWLRTHDDDRERYEWTKRDLVTREWQYVQNYADAKTEVVEEINRRADCRADDRDRATGPRGGSRLVDTRCGGPYRRHTHMKHLFYFRRPA